MFLKSCLGFWHHLVNIEKKKKTLFNFQENIQQFCLYFISVAINAGCCLFPSYISVLVGILSSYFALLAIPMFDNL